MASGYNTGQYTPVDFLGQLPKELMLAAIQNADAQNQKIDDTASLLKENLLKVKFLDQDREDVVRKQQEYNAAIDGLTTKLGSDRTNWKSHMGTIRDLGRQLSADLSTGELSAIQGNYSQYQTALTEAKKRLDEKAIRQDQYDKTLQAGLTNFQGTKWKGTNEYNKINVERPVDYVDFNSVVQEAVKGMEKQGFTKEFDSFSGGYIWRNKTTQETRDYNQIVNAAYSTALQDDKVMDYFKQGSRLGYTGNLYNEDGTMKSLYTDKKDAQGAPVQAKDAKGNPLKDAAGNPIYEREMNMSHPWALGLNAVGMTNQVSNETQSQTQVGAEVYGKAKFDQGLAKDLAAFKSSLDEGRDIRAEDRAAARDAAKEGVVPGASLAYMDEAIKNFAPGMLNDATFKLADYNRRIKNGETLSPEDQKKHKLYEELNNIQAQRYAKEGGVPIKEQNDLKRAMNLYNAGQTDTPEFKELMKKTLLQDAFVTVNRPSKTGTYQVTELNPKAINTLKTKFEKMTRAYNNYSGELSDMAFTQRAVVIDESSSAGKQLTSTFDMAAKMSAQDGNTFDPNLNPDFGQKGLKIKWDGWFDDNDYNLSSEKLSEVITKAGKGDPTKKALIPTKVSQQSDGSVTYSVKVNKEATGNRVKITDVNGNEVTEFKWTVKNPYIHQTNIDIVHKTGSVEALKGVSANPINDHVSYNLNRLVPSTSTYLYNPYLPNEEPVSVSRIDASNYEVRIPNMTAPYTPVVGVFSADQAQMEINNYMRQQVQDEEEKRQKATKK